jgi:predicted porin
MKFSNAALSAALLLALGNIAVPRSAHAQSDNDAMKRQIDSLQRQIDELKKNQGRAAEPSGSAAESPGRGAAPVTADAAIQIYGHLDLSVDSATKGMSEGRTNAGGATAVGKLGWQPDVSANLSYVGIRAARNVAEDLRAIFQFETQIDVAATPGPSVSSSSTDPSVKGALASRNSFLGIAGGWGAVKAGKTDAPYKLSTARMDPFSASVGDYNSIMGNTGGDNRAEFDTRLSHAVWYESPDWSGLRFSALVSPGQNRASDNSIAASGEPSCTGGNGVVAPSVVGTCTDGSFGTAYSVAAIYEAGPLYLTAAYEKHKDVNRTGDEDGVVVAPGLVGVKDEQAWKAGVQYAFPSRTTANFIYERMTRNAPASTFNERQRNGTWLAVTQKVSDRDDINAGWAHAGKTPGDPVAGGPVDNQANMLSLGYKHHWDRQTNWYAVYARQANHSGAHYDLGASGHGITTDCHDANGNCFPGTTLQALSVGMQYNF